jgi:hypothetical protein
MVALDLGAPVAALNLPRRSDFVNVQQCRTNPVHATALGAHTSHAAGLERRAIQVAVDSGEHAELHAVPYGEVVACVAKGYRDLLIAAIRWCGSVGGASGRSWIASRRRDCGSSQTEALATKERVAVKSRVERGQVGCRDVLLVLYFRAPFARLNGVECGAREEEAETITDTHGCAIKVRVECRKLVLRDLRIVGDAPAAIAGDDLVQSAALTLECGDLEGLGGNHMN